MHHFMSTPVPSTSVPYTLHCTLTFPPPITPLFVFPPVLPPLATDDRAEMVFTPSSLSFPLSCSVLSGEADRPHSTGRPRRPFLTRLSVTPLPYPSISPLQTTSAPSPSPTMCSLFAPPFTSISSGCMSHRPSPSRLLTHLPIMSVTIASTCDAGI